MSACDECGLPLDPDVIHINHRPYCDPSRPNGCDCPEVCASCCTDPSCPLARQIPGQLTLDEAT